MLTENNQLKSLYTNTSLGFSTISLSKLNTHREYRAEIFTNNIAYIFSRKDHHAGLLLKAGENFELFETYKNIGELLLRLPPWFKKIHRSLIVNRYFILHAKNNFHYLVMANHDELPVGNTHIDEVREWLRKNEMNTDNTGLFYNSYLRKSS